jgi:hypothetical protein
VYARRLSVVGIVIALSACPKKEPAAPEPAHVAFHEGDVLASRGAEVRVSKILKIEPFPGGGLTFHVLSYRDKFTSVDDARAAYRNKKLHVLIMHAPIDSADFSPEKDVVLANEPVTDAELEGYRTYLEMTKGSN